MSDSSRKVGVILVGVGGVTAGLALLCCIAPWLLAGFLIALGLSFILKDVLLLAIAAAGVLLALSGFWLRRNTTKGESA